MRADPAPKRFVEPLRFALQQPGADFDSHSAQFCKSSSTCFWIRILHRRHHPGNSRADQGFGAWTGASAGIARLHRSVSRRTFCTPSCLVQCNNFRMVAQVILMEALAKDVAILHDYATYR